MTSIHLNRLVISPNRAGVYWHLKYVSGLASVNQEAGLNFYHFEVEDMYGERRE
jgi:hypothetical protein